MHAIESLNTSLFLLVNASAHPPPLLVEFARGAAQDLIFLVCLVPVLLWVRDRRDRRGRLLAAALGAALGLGVNFLIASIWYHPRPFEIGVGHQWLAHAPETSFPSDHATLSFALGLGLLLTGAARAWGVATVAAAALIAWARVYLGVHWPLDMLGSLVVGTGAALAARAVRGPVERVCLGPFERLYERALRILHLPPPVFLRRQDHDHPAAR